MANVLIAVVSCRTRREWTNTISSTWLKYVPEGADVRFFVGRGEPTAWPDEIVLDCDDSYQGLPEKVQGIVRWALANGYDHVLKLDDDVVIDPVEMLKSNFKQPFVGTGGHRPNPQRPYYVPSGFAYWMDKTSMEYVANAPLPSDNYDEGWVAGVLHAQGISLTLDPRYYVTVCRVLPTIEGRRVGRIATRVRREPAKGTFAWCIYFEPNGGKRYSTEEKIKEFKRVFAAEVAAKR